MYFLFVLAGLMIYLLRCYIHYQADQPRTYFISKKKEQKVNHFTEQTFDENCTDYFNLLIKVLTLCTYNNEKFKSVTLEDFPFRRLEEDIEFIFTEEIFKSMLRNHLINETIVPKLLKLKEITSKITADEWFFEKVDLDLDTRWKEINRIAEELLTDLKIEQRTNNIEY